MGVFLTIGCYLVAFSPALAIFTRFVAPDPLRIILFVLGAFLWLVSLLLSSLVWLFMSVTWSSLPVTVGISIVFQGLAKIFYFWLLKKAQHGLNKMAKGGPSVAPGVTDLHNARHMLALVCGLGMGVTAALFFTMNVFAEFSGPGSFGLPSALQRGTVDNNSAGEYLPLYYALSGLLLTLLHITWNIMIWESCHRVGAAWPWPMPLIAAFASHFFVSGISSQNEAGLHEVVLVVQFVVLFLCILYSHYIIGGTIQTLARGIANCLRDWFTLSWIRSLKGRGHAYAVEEMEATERVVPT